jgi:hypothetical protein
MSGHDTMGSEDKRSSVDVMFIPFITHKSCDGVKLKMQRD